PLDDPPHPPRREPQGNKRRQPPHGEARRRQAQARNRRGL
ncbi:hypothetical protein BN1708_020228, partial [Verticillium longisporum]